MGEKDLEISWTGNWENITIVYKGDLVGTIPSEKELLEGRNFNLSDGRVLRIWYSNKHLEYGIYLEVNGEPVPQSAGDPENIIAFAAALTFVIGGISLILGAVVLIFDFNVLKAAGFYGFSVGVGAILLVSAVFILWRKRWALILAFIILILETLIGTYATIYFNLDPNMSILLLRVLSLFPLYKALVVFNKIYPRKKQ